MTKFQRMKPLIKNKSAEIYYRKALNQELQRFLDLMLKKIEENYSTIKVNNASYDKFKNPKDPTINTFERLIKFFKNNWQNILLDNSRKIINKFVKLALKNINNSSKEKLFEIGVPIRSNAKDYEEILKIIIKRNVGLIQNVSEQTINNIENIVSNAMINNQPYSEIYKNLKHQKEVVGNRVNLIADDQIRKTNEAINRLNQQMGGIKYFEWWGIDDSRERPGHKELNGKIFKWGDVAERLPIISKNKNGVVRGYPGEAVRCRCTALGYDVDLNEYKEVWLGNNKGYKFVKR